MLNERPECVTRFLEPRVRAALASVDFLDRSAARQLARKARHRELNHQPNGSHHPIPHRDLGAFGDR